MLPLGGSPLGLWTDHVEGPATHRGGCGSRTRRSCLRRAERRNHPPAFAEKLVTASSPVGCHRQAVSDSTAIQRYRVLDWLSPRRLHVGACAGGERRATGAE